MEKEQKNVNWPTLKTEAKVSVDVEESHIVSYPSSAKNKKDWEKLEREIAVDIDKNKEEYGIDPLNSFFK